jgi:homoserine dehydrogenase
MTAIAFLGYGTVARALHALLERHDVPFTVTGVRDKARRVDGEWRSVPRRATNGSPLRNLTSCSKPSALEPQTGQPALDYLRAVLEHGATRDLGEQGSGRSQLSRADGARSSRGKRYRFESAVMDGAPLFSLVRECLPLAGLRGVRGIFTSTATIVLEAIEEGRSLADGIAHALQLGIAEADPSYDVDGWIRGEAVRVGERATRRRFASG